MKCPCTEQHHGEPRAVVGCGSANVEGPDHEGLMDCLDCGMWFRPEEAERAVRPLA